MAGRSRRLSVRLTGRGWQAVVIGGVVILAARLIGTTQLHQLGYALLALPVASLFVALLFFRGTLFERGLPSGARLEAGIPAPVTLAVRNRSRFGTSTIEGTDMIPDQTDFEFDPVPSGGRGEIRTETVFPRRGVYALGPASLSVVDPFDLVRLTRTFPEKRRVTVYPKVHKLPGSLFPGKGSDSGGRGRVGQRGEEFAGLREYRRGDDRRSIHWKSLARTGDLYVKETALHAPKRHTVALDLRRQGGRVRAAQVEDAVSIAASVLALLNAEGLPLRLIHNGSEGDGQHRDVAFGSGEEAYWREMGRLATVTTGVGKPLAAMLLEEAGSLGEGVVVVSSGTDAELPETMAALVRGGVSVSAILVPPPGVPGGSGRRDGQAFAEHADGLGRAGASVTVARRVGGAGEMEFYGGNAARGSVART